MSEVIRLCHYLRASSREGPGATGLLRLLLTHTMPFTLRLRRETESQEGMATRR